MEICFRPAFQAQKQPKKLSGRAWKSVEIFLIILLFQVGGSEVAESSENTVAGTGLPYLPQVFGFRDIACHLCYRMFGLVEKIKLHNSPRNVTLRAHGRQRYTGLQTEQEGLWARQASMSRAREASMSRAREGWTYYMEESTGTRSTGTVDTNRSTS